MLIPLEKLVIQSEKYVEKKLKNRLNNNIEKLLTIFFPVKQVELPRKSLEQLAFSPRPEIEADQLIVMGKSTREEKSSQPLQTINKQFKVAITFLIDFAVFF